MYDNTIKAKAYRSAESNCYNPVERGPFAAGYELGATQEKAIFCKLLEEHAGEVITVDLIAALRACDQEPKESISLRKERSRRKSRETTRKWRERNPNYDVAYRTIHADEIKAKRIKYYATHREEILAIAKARYAAKCAKDGRG